MASLAKRRSAHEKQYAIRKFVKSNPVNSRGLRTYSSKMTIPRGPIGKTFPV